MICDDLIAEAKVQIEAGDYNLANAYMNSARAGIQSARTEVIRAAAQAALDDFERIETARRLCKYALAMGHSGRATLRFLRAVENAPQPDLCQPITGAHNARAFAWHTQNRSAITDLLHDAAEESATSGQI